MESAEAALARLCDPEAAVSAHYLISRRGGITRMVPEESRAWHAGSGEWAGMTDINSRSIGIELDNGGDHPFSEPLMDALEALLGDIMARQGIGPEGVIGHSCMAPGRKTDPGPRFDWARLARQGLAISAEAPGVPSEITEETFCKAAWAAGFTAEAPFETLLQTTRLRFAPWRRGPLSQADFALGSADKD
ncbi:MAG: N-acetylmuramoyl-L-alanine amidase [Sulfitobacter sp.]|nr:N-acetylmuramoyl-L-alanine amidase [Sulfitobacter sp.]